MATQLLGPLLAQHGYAADQGGLLAFLAAGAAWRDDPELAALAKAIRDRVVPAAMLPAITAMLEANHLAPV